MIEKEKYSNSLADTLVFSALLVSPVLITTWINFDPVNLPRLLLISGLSFPGLLYLISKLVFKGSIRQLTKQHKALLLISAAFCLAVLNSWFFSGADLTSQFYGQFGRNNGVLAYLGLVILLVTATFSPNSSSGSKLRISVLVGGIVNLIYGLIQWFNFDPIAWQNPYGRVVGTLGNPNFMSSFMALFGIYLLSRLIYLRNFKIKETLPPLLLLIPVIFIVWSTGSIQGMVVLLVGGLSLILVRFSILSSFRRVLIVFLGAVFASCFALLSLLGKGPLGSALYQSTLEVRTFFWASALKMLQANPFNGFGMDTFGDWYRKYRSEESTQFAGDLNADSAHNVFLDFGAWGGIPLLVTWLLLNLFILSSVLRHLRKARKVDSDFAFLFAAWVGYLLQSLVSINQLTLAIYGFVLAGLLFSRTLDVNISPKEAPKRQVKTPVALLFFIVGIVVAFPALRADANFRLALANQEGSRLIQTVNEWPRNDTYLFFVARILLSNGFENQAVRLSRAAIEVNPQNLQALVLIHNSNLTPETEKSILKEKIKDLDPWLKQGLD